MSTRSGPYDIDGTWYFEHDMMSDAESLDKYGDVFRIYATGMVMEVAVQKFDLIATLLPEHVVAAIRAQFDLPNSYCIEHARLYSVGAKCKHCSWLSDGN